MKRIISLLLALAMFLSMSVTAFAASPDALGDDIMDELVITDDQPRAEETKWYYRIYDNLIQRRLWSITYGYWKTDWITIGYVDPNL